MIEFCASLLGVFCIYLYIKQKMAAWPLSMIQVLMYAFVFFKAKLYPDCALQFFFLTTQIYGWYQWCLGSADKQASLAVTRLPIKHFFTYLITFAMTSLLVGMMMNNYTDAQFAYADSLIAVISILGQLLLAHKKIECWVVWMLVNAMAVFVYHESGLYETTVLYAIFFALAVKGFIDWQKLLKQNHDFCRRDTEGCMSKK